MIEIPGFLSHAPSFVTCVIQCDLCYLVGCTHRLLEYYYYRHPIDVAMRSRGRVNPERELIVTSLRHRGYDLTRTILT